MCNTATTGGARGRSIIGMIVAVLMIGAGVGCAKQPEPLLVYSGKGLKLPVEEIRAGFERKTGIPVQVLYDGSNTLLEAIWRTQKGDVFIPGSQAYIKLAGDLIVSDSYVAPHVPVFVVRTDNPKRLRGYQDLLSSQVRIAIGNENMAAIGKVAFTILNNARGPRSFEKNIVVKGNTVNELLWLVNEREVDAALVWKDMLSWEAAAELSLVEIPDDLNSPKAIHVAVLGVSQDLERATRFAEYVATEGKAIFARNGFE